MYIYVRIMAIISIMSSMVLHAQYRPSCAQIKHGTRPESFVQRITCARQAVLGGNALAAYELMAPIYRDARNSTSNTRSESQAKLSALVELQLPDTGRQLIKQYGIDDVYTALAQTANIDPATGSAAASKRTLAQPLVTSVANALQSARGSKPVSGRAAKTEEPVQPRELTAEEKDMVVKAQRQVAKAFALNNMLDNLFFIAVKNNNPDVCQNLISAIKQPSDSNIKALVDIVALYHKQGDNAQATYELLASKLASYKIAQWLGFGNKNKTTQELFDLWIDTAPSLQLLTALEKSGMPTNDQEGRAGSYLFRQNVGTNDLRVSKAIMLMRNAKSLLFEPGGGQTFKTPSPLMAVVTVSAIYQALHEGLLAHNFIIEPDTQFVVHGKKLTLDDIDTQLAQIIADEAARVMMEMEELRRQGHLPTA